MSFEWDSAKNKSNFEKHEIAFEDAIVIFQGKTVETVSNQKDYQEERIIALGEVFEGVVICVVYTWRGNNRRIISARMAHRKERNTYYGEN